MKEKKKKDKIEDLESNITGEKQNEELETEKDSSTESEEKSNSEKADEIISELENQVKELQDKYLRKVAEFENYKRRVESDQFNLINYGAESFLIKLLPVVDDFERSLQHVENAKDVDAVKEGIKLVYEKLIKALDEQGVKKMKSVGEPFNVDYHDALMQRKDESVEPHTVVEEIEPGYIYRDKVIRHAKVIVSEDISENSIQENESNREDAENEQKD